MTIKRIAELSFDPSTRNLRGRQLIVIEANKIAGALERCFEGDMELLYSDSVVKAYQNLRQQLLSDICKIKEHK
jgi:hypothetical protein